MLNPSNQSPSLGSLLSTLSIYNGALSPEPSLEVIIKIKDFINAERIHLLGCENKDVQRNLQELATKVLKKDNALAQDILSLSISVFKDSTAFTRIPLDVRLLMLPFEKPRDFKSAIRVNTGFKELSVRQIQAIIRKLNEERLPIESLGLNYDQLVNFLQSYGPEIKFFKTNLYNGRYSCVQAAEIVKLCPNLEVLDSEGIEVFKEEKWEAFSAIFSMKLPRLTALKIGLTFLSKNLIEKLVKSAFFNQLVYLDLQKAGLNLGSFKVLLPALHSSKIHILNISVNNLGDEGILLAKETQAFNKCTHLFLLGLGLTDNDLNILATIPFDALTVLNLDNNNFATLKPLVESRAFPKLEELFVRQGSLPKEEIDALKNSSNFRTLKIFE